MVRLMADLPLRPRVLVTRRIFDDVVDRLREWFDVETNADDRVFSKVELIDRVRDKAGMLITGTEPIDEQLLTAAPWLRAVCSMAVGYNNIDVDACTVHGVIATNAPDVLTETTADFGFALMMATARRITESEHYLRAGRWQRWSYDLLAGQDVHGATLGILGMGRIGQAIARRGALGFGMTVLYHNRRRIAETDERALHASWVSKEELLRRSDHLVVVLPYSRESHHAIGAAELALMQPTATLTNIARGGVVDDAALATALREARIAAAGLDVFEGEPQVHPGLLSLSNVVLTPHIASATMATRHAMASLAADNLIAALGAGAHAGHPPTPLNPGVLPRDGQASA
jgi:glyoxylate/hydroxypyruvate/2-ketogluconate reductase